MPEGSAQDEAAGWNAIVTPALTYTDVSYVNGDSVTLRLPPFPVYDLEKAEIISVNLPPAAVVSKTVAAAGRTAVVGQRRLSAECARVRGVAAGVA